MDYKKITHYIAGAILAGATWVAYNPEKMKHVVALYPKLSILTGVATLILALYHNPVPVSK